MESINKMSHVLWGLDWQLHLPLVLTHDGISVELGNYESASAFVSEHYSRLFEQGADSPFSSAHGQAKERYYRLAADFFEFKHQGRCVALFICDPWDWSTYYFRSAAVLEEYQGRQLLPLFCEKLLFKKLEEAGVERIESDTSPANLPMLHILTRLRFNVSGNLLTDRWGAMVHFTRYLNARNKNVFLEQFCSGVKYQLRKEEA